MTTNAKINAGGRLQAMAPDRQAFFLLRTVFTVAPILFGLDKFTNILTDWTIYLAPVATSACRCRRRPLCTSSASWRSSPAW